MKSYVGDIPGGLYATCHMSEILDILPQLSYRVHVLMIMMPPCLLRTLQRTYMNAVLSDIETRSLYFVHRYHD